MNPWSARMPEPPSRRTLAAVAQQPQSPAAITQLVASLVAAPAGRAVPPDNAGVQVMTTLNLERTRPEQNEADAARHHRHGSSVQASSAGLSTRGRRVLVGLGTAAAALIAVAMLGSPSSPAQSAATPTAWEQERLATQVRGTPVAATPTAWEQERVATQVNGTA